MLTESEAVALQEMLRQRVIATDAFPAPVRLIAGADVEYDKHSDLIAGAIVLLDADTKAVLEVATHVMPVAFPYVPGLFSFREMPRFWLLTASCSRRPTCLFVTGTAGPTPGALAWPATWAWSWTYPRLGAVKPV
ncbi:endonuclease V [Hymenobacter cellulosilyticus]|uniref:Endonuclease V n=1 Tax=Hymenobacter cellulosilyticus TaxID=2932248 RepID=A0A8T9Q2B3_9BACT|nr:endonuclease V [Hymenobacter cellulosilyticus]UOQ71674.1 endonuclease V [Hymenobacter cellulosilyticus]